MRWQPATFLLTVILFTTAHAEEFHVATDGVDDDVRDGLTRKTAWASLAYACERTSEITGPQTIRLHPGTYIATRTAYPKSNTTLVGGGSRGKDRTEIVASPDWELSAEFKPDAPPEEEHLIAFRKQENIAVKDLSLISNPEHRITGGILATASNRIHFENLNLRDFRWNGIFLNVCQDLVVTNCHFEDTSTERMRYWGGHLRSRYLKDAEISHNRIIGRVGGGYGYKAGGHTNARIHHNFIDVRNGFGIESAHENEYGVEIDHNWINNCISIPKGGQAADPNEKGFEYSFWIHHNFLSHSYTIEGPRNHLLFEHNHVNISSTNGRVYTHHGGINHGPVTIRYNVIENVDRALIWMNNGLAENIEVYHNSIFCADAGTRTGSLLGVGSPERLNGWSFRNNLVIAAWSQPRGVAPANPEVRAKMEISGNLFLNFLDVPEGNFTDEVPGVTRNGNKPGPFWHPLGEESFVVDRGIDLGDPYEGSAPDIGAFEFGRDPWTLEGIPHPRW